MDRSLDLALVGVATEMVTEAPGATGDALIGASRRTAALLRKADGTKLVPLLAWSVADTAAHLVTILQHSRAFVTGEEDASRYATLVPASASTADRSAAANAWMLDEFTERDVTKLADLLTIAAEAFVAVADHRQPDEPVLIEAGVAMTVPTLTAVLLGEQLVHGHDIAGAVHRSWVITRPDATRVLSASIAMLPEIINTDQIADLHATFELRLRGGPRHRVPISDGIVAVDEADDRVDCWISVDPVASLLLSYGRVGRWRQILTGRMIAGGRKPWLATRLGNLLTPI